MFGWIMRDRAWERPVYSTIAGMMRDHFEYGGSRPDVVLMNGKTHAALGREFGGHIVSVMTDYGKLDTVVSETFSDGQIVLAERLRDGDVYLWLASKGAARELRQEGPDVGSKYGGHEWTSLK